MIHEGEKVALSREDFSSPVEGTFCSVWICVVMPP